MLFPYIWCRVAIIKVGGVGAVFDRYESASPLTTLMGGLLKSSSAKPENLLGYGIGNENVTQDMITNTIKYGECGKTDPYALHIFRPISDMTYPWLGILIGSVISSVWYWCSDQVIVQRTLAAKNLTYGKLGCVVAGYLKVLPMLLILMPGMAARILFPDQIGCSDPKACEEFCNKPGGCADSACAHLPSVAYVCPLQSCV